MWNLNIIFHSTNLFQLSCQCEVCTFSSWNEFLMIIFTFHILNCYYHTFPHPKKLWPKQSPNARQKRKQKLQDKVFVCLCIFIDASNPTTIHSNIKFHNHFYYIILFHFSRQLVHHTSISYSSFSLFIS